MKQTPANIESIASNIISLKQQKENLLSQLELSREYGAPSMRKAQQEGVYENQIKRFTRAIIETEHLLSEAERG